MFNLLGAGLSASSAWTGEDDDRPPAGTIPQSGDKITFPPSYHQEFLSREVAKKKKDPPEIPHWME